MKKGSGFILLIVGLVLASGFVSAQSSDVFAESVSRVIDGATSVVKPFFQFLLGDYSGSDIFLIKSLLLILVFVMVNVALGTMPRLGDNKVVVIIVSFVVSVLAVRFISENQIINGILLPYGTLGIALTTILPFLIFFYFVHATKMGGLGRRLMWGFFGLVFVSLFISRYDELVNSPGVANPLQVQYFYYALFALIVAAFAFDRGIHRYFFMHELNVFKRGAQSKVVVALQAEYLNIVSVDSPEAEKRRAAIEKQLKDLGGSLP